MNREELLHLIALTQIKGIGSVYTRLLIETYGSARGVFEADRRSLAQLPRIGELLSAGVNDPKVMERAQRELDFIEAHNIRVSLYGTPDYPQRLSSCMDAPAVLYSIGSTPIDSPHVVSIVGTRRCTPYGRDMVNDFVRDLATLVPDAVIVSGLALGIDVSAHKAAIAHGLPTIGVVAHGLDRIYPSIHRNIARQMIASGGGLITEYTSGTSPERGNFLARNRIVAGMADAVIVAETGDHGGSLVTASIAQSYDRDVYAFPGRATDEKSAGCNRLIRSNAAGLITSAEDLVNAMGWECRKQLPKTQEQEIPFDNHISPLGRELLALLKEQDSMTLSALAQQTGHDSSTLTEELLSLEMDNLIHRLPGSRYRVRGTYKKNTLINSTCLWRRAKRANHRDARPS